MYGTLGHTECPISYDIGLVTMGVRSAVKLYKPIVEALIDLQLLITAEVLVDVPREESEHGLLDKFSLFEFAELLLTAENK